MNPTQLRALVDEATMDCYDEDEQVMGLYTMIQDNLDLPFETMVVGVWRDGRQRRPDRQGCIVAQCARGQFRQAVSILDLPLPTPPPDGAQGIDAYRHWADRP